MSTEIICRGGFCPGFSVTSRLNPYNSVLYSLDIIPNPAAGSQAFEHTFFDFFEIFRQIGHIFPLCGIESRFFACFAAFLHSFSVSLRPAFLPLFIRSALATFPAFCFFSFPSPTSFRCARPFLAFPPRCPFASFAFFAPFMPFIVPYASRIFCPRKNARPRVFV